MNANQIEIPLPAPVFHMLTERAKECGLSREEYLKKIAIENMKADLEKKKFLLSLNAQNTRTSNERTFFEDMALCRQAGVQSRGSERPYTGNLFNFPFS